MIGHGQRPAAKETNEKGEAGEGCMPEQPVKPRQVSSASSATNIASESTNQAAIVGTKAPKRSNSDSIRLSLQDHGREHEIGAKRRRSDNDPAQCFDFLRLC